jgi:hypothetical protein
VALEVEEEMSRHFVERFNGQGILGGRATRLVAGAIPKFNLIRDVIQLEDTAILISGIRNVLLKR